MIEPRNTPCSHEVASFTSGTTEARRPPNRIAEIGTPFGSSHSGAIDGHWEAGAVKRAFGCAASVGVSGVQGLPSQSVRRGGFSGVMPSHHTSPSGVSAVFVKTQFSSRVIIALGFVSMPVPGATPKNPASGLIA